MQKIFNKYTIIIISIAVLSILVINFFLSAKSLEKQQFNTFSVKIGQVIQTMERNQSELESITENLDEDYLTRAKAAAYVVEKNPSVLESVEEIQNLAELLNVDELHVSDSAGIIAYSSVPRYIGLDFHGGKQMRGFLPILESDAEDEYVIQEAQPNTAEGKMMKYVGVSRKGIKGIVQVGLEPVRQLEAQEKNTYDYIFSRFPTEQGEEFFAIDTKDGSVIGYTEGMEAADEAQTYSVSSLKKYEDGGYWKDDNGEKRYIVTRMYDHVLIGASISEAVLYQPFWRNILLTFLYLALVEVIAVILLNYLVKQKVVSGIHHILEDLSHITKGDLDTKVEVGGNPEFQDLSDGINTMVNSIVRTTDRISKIIDIAEIPLAAFEYQEDMKDVFVTSRLNELLDLPKEEVERISRSPGQFLEMIRTIMKSPIEGEPDVFCIHDKKYIRIHLSVDDGHYLGAVLDATKEVLDKRRMFYENNHDQLTGLSRYAYFKYQASQWMEQMEKDEICAAVMMDLDEFKRINDTYGHDVGDKYLESFAALLKGLPQEHCLVSRRSGDEFCIFICGFQDISEIQKILKELWRKLREEEAVITQDVIRKIRASGGVAYARGQSRLLEDLLLEADQALYEVKRENKGLFKEYDADKCQEA